MQRVRGYSIPRGWKSEILQEKHVSRQLADLPEVPVSAEAVTSGEERQVP